MAKHSGKLVVSLDFEIMWGVRDIVTVHDYGEHLRGVHQALPKLLEYFKKYHLRGTFATVGLLFFENKDELLQHLPAVKPKYTDPNLSPYGEYLIKNVGLNNDDDPYHFAPQLIKLIKNTPHQEIGTHTFSHFYCQEDGQTITDFKHDLKAALAIAKSRGIDKLTSIVFPRNQVNHDYFKVCKELGIIAYRGNEDSWIYTVRSIDNKNLFRRSFKLIDAYVNISGHHCYADEYLQSGALINIPSSRFLRPYSKSLRFFEALRLNRIKESMTYAAKNSLLYHLWWHPHNFGINQNENFSFLEKVLQHYAYLNKKYDFTSYTMSEVAEMLIKKTTRLIEK